MPTLTVMVGLPASGKSTYLKFVDDPEFGDTVFVYSTDRYIESCAQLNGMTYNEAFDEFIKPATKNMNDLLKIAFRQGVDVFWDQTNMSAKKRAKILRQFPAHYRKVCVCFVPPQNDDEWAELQRRLVSRPGKSIPSHIIESMADSYVQPTLAEGFDEVKLLDIYAQPINP